MAHPFLRSVLSTLNRRRPSIGPGALLRLAGLSATAAAQGPGRDGENVADCNQNEIPDYIEIQLGLGAEMGISTTKLHAYGPMGLAELCALKWVGFGEGHVRT